MLKTPHTLHRPPGHPEQASSRETEHPIPQGVGTGGGVCLSYRPMGQKVTQRIMGRQRHPNQKSTWDSFQGKRRKAEDPKKEYVSSVENGLKALEAVQASRPAKPPGRR